MGLNGSDVRGMARRLAMGVVAVGVAMALGGCGQAVTGGAGSADVAGADGGKALSDSKLTGHVDASTLVSDDTKIVYHDSSGLSTFVFYYEGDAIVGYSVWFDYGDEEAAQLAYDATLEDPGDLVKDVHLDGTQVSVDYEPGAYENMTVADVRDTYDYLVEATEESLATAQEAAEEDGAEGEATAAE